MEQCIPQVGWKLEVCTKPSNDDGELDAGTNARDNVKSNEPDGALKDSNSSPRPPSNTNSPEMSAATCSNQPNDMQTGTSDENNIDSNQHAHTSHRNPPPTAPTENNHPNNMHIDQNNIDSSQHGQAISIFVLEC